MPAVLFGSISTIADTSELQRAAFNEAFQTHGLSWVWDREDYVARLENSGGEQRIADYAESIGEQVDAAAVHATKSEVFQQNLATSGIEPRAGVVETIRAAKSLGLKVALVTTTSPANVTALLEAVQEQIPAADFDLVVDATTVTDPKPDAAAYAYALQNLGEQADTCIAIEDNLGGVDSAVAAGVRVVAFPNENTSGHAFDKAERVVDHVDLGELRTVLTAGKPA